MPSLYSLLLPFVLSAVALSLAGCAREKKETDLGGDNVKVQIPMAIGDDYQMGVVELFTLKSVKNLKGLAARFLIEPEAGNGQLTGRSPTIRYIRDKDGVVVAKDAISLQLLTTYAHIEKLRELEERAGAGGVLSYPRSVAVNVQYKNAQGEADIDNALYSGKFDALLVVPFTRPTLPLMANAGVIGHEQFHALFQKLVVAPLGEKYPEAEKSTNHDEKKMALSMGLYSTSSTVSMEKSENRRRDINQTQSQIRSRYHAVLLRSINEGLADVWGWIYSGDNGFVGRSIREKKLERDLQVVPHGLDDGKELLKRIESEQNNDHLIYYSYILGTQLARALRDFAGYYAVDNNLTLDQVRPLMAQYLVSLMPELKKQFEALKEDEYFSLARMMPIFSMQVKNLNSRQCNMLAKQMHEDDRKKIPMSDQCKEIEKREHGSENERKDEHKDEKPQP